MPISITEIKPRKAKFAFRCSFDDDIIDNCAFINDQTRTNPDQWQIVASNAGNFGTLNVYTNDEGAAEHFRSALAFSKEFHSSR